jgi:hypothetical protein
MKILRTIGLSLLFLVGALIAVIFLSILIFLRSLIRGARAFHPHGTVCRAEVTALDDVVGPRLAGPARVRLSSATEDENSPNPSILGMAIKLGTDQDLPVATFESFLKSGEATKNTNVADYLGNQYASVSPWRVRGLGVIWFRAIPHPDANTPKTGTRVERLDADIAASRAKFILEAREAPGPDGAVRSRLVELRLTERLPDDDPKFQISMFRTGRGLVPTGFRNGIRAIVYPVSQFARRLRGG